MIAIEKENQSMKRLSLITLIVVSSVVIGLTVGGASTSSAFQKSQRKSFTTLQTTRINAQTIKTLTRGKKVVADLTKRGVVYEFDVGAGQIDFSRVVVRTARGEVTIDSLLKRMIPKDKLTTFKYTTRSFKLGTRPTGSLTPTLMKTSNFVCDTWTCTCRGLEDCEGLILGTTLCTDWFCFLDEHGKYVCVCAR